MGGLKKICTNYSGQTISLLSLRFFDGKMIGNLVQDEVYTISREIRVKSPVGQVIFTANVIFMT